MRVGSRIEIPAPPDRVWRALVRWEDQARWMPDVDRVRVLSEEREGVGVMLAARTRVLGVPAFTDRLEVVAWQPFRRITVAHRKFVRGTGLWLLEPAGEATRFTWVEDLALPIPLLGELALWTYRPIQRWHMRRALAGLVALLAAQPSEET